ncbi:unnamed protein product [Polarella glacialis]|uniref:Uncharacterized protein n=1 Tax=Polarella glacialis TaxID=89957 RepID=A0A813GJX1_POLGL|nr:unnamed protein product [Polarella glacialis]
MVKRTAPKAPVSPVKAKAARKSDEAVEVDGHFAEECSPILELISQASGVSEACREMLLAMSPHCLKSAKSSRHEFQHQMVEVLSKVVAGVEAEQTSAVQAAEAEVSEMTSQKEAAANVATAAQEATEVATTERDAKDAAMRSAGQAATDADVAQAAARNSVASLESEREELVAGKSEYEALISGTWADLKAGSIPGQKWRERAKLITGVVEMLEKVGLDASLKDGLPVALKTKPSERGKFAEQTVEYAEALLLKHVAATEAKLGSMDSEAASRAQAVTGAEAALAAATHLKEQSEEATAAAEATLVEKTKELAAARKAEKALEPKAKHVNVAWEDAKRSLEEVQALASKFQALCEEPAPTAAEAEEEEMPEAPTTVAEVEASAEAPTVAEVAA